TCSSRPSMGQGEGEGDPRCTTTAGTAPSSRTRGPASCGASCAASPAWTRHSSTSTTTASSTWSWWANPRPSLPPAVACSWGATLELRAGDLYQLRLVTDRVTHFGLGRRLKADVLRVRWPNGVSQTVYYPGTEEDVLEQQILKGSCPFLYAWDGHAFSFVTDVMWRSALGMPLGIMAGGTDIASAPPHAS